MFETRVFNKNCFHIVSVSRIDREYAYKRFQKFILRRNACAMCTRAPVQCELRHFHRAFIPFCVPPRLRTITSFEDQWFSQQKRKKHTKVQVHAVRHNSKTPRAIYCTQIYKMYTRGRENATFACARCG